ncbi:hypothetical protein CDD80_7316 [Ophiocordyceps camponoti-rufipedis]|uniref:RNA exonuclease 4 n=1 Tax=Ophiocordyceps camponoti-rufipedis TaxID=2004952 RepID=A0A2C5ZEJ2_9HYPO|nr:hypothetical protein CDD80_7316 [Ophiocordyceps camponoti-rufipedis]
MDDLSSNWKKLQALLYPGKTLTPSSKRKADNSSTPQRQAKNQKLAVNPITTAHERDTNLSGRPSMGGVHSSPVQFETRNGPSPSPALWTGDDPVSSETLADAYKLGLKGDATAKKADRLNYGLSEGIQVGKFLALDCEMVGVGSGGYESALARVSVVDFHGQQIYDSFVKPKERVTDWRTPVSGVSPKDMRMARDFKEVQAQISDLLKDRVLVGHDIKHDLTALKLSHPARDIRDTALYPGFKQYAYGRKPALRVLAKQLLGTSLHDGAHSSVEDARATMLLFRNHKSGFDADHANRFPSKKGPTTQDKRKKADKGKKALKTKKGGPPKAKDCLG